MSGKKKSAIPPDLVADYAKAHDDGTWAAFLDLIGYTTQPAPGQHELADASTHVDRDSFGESSDGKGRSKGNSSQNDPAMSNWISRCRCLVENKRKHA